MRADPGTRAAAASGLATAAPGGSIRPGIIVIQEIGVVRDLRQMGIGGRSGIGMVATAEETSGLGIFTIVLEAAQGLDAFGIDSGFMGGPHAIKGLDEQGRGVVINRTGTARPIRTLGRRRSWSGPPPFEGAAVTTVVLQIILTASTLTQ